MRRGLLWILSLFVVLLALEARAAEFVVIEATGASLKPGETIDGSKPLVLKEGELVSLVAEDGNVLKLRGPYNQAPDAATGGGLDVSKALAALVSGQRSEYGVIRSKVDNVDLPAPWVVDVSHSGKVCLRSGERLVFWRPDGSRDVTLTIMPVDRSWRAQAEWPQGAAQMEAPSGFPLKERRTYLFSMGGRTSALTLLAVPDTLTNDHMRAAWMLEMNCLAQTKALLSAMR
ncbi:MAG TPA: hypothetical protein VEC75_12720 [Stellaceae bacterium]|nr:hypothetical protein [Stellaceae bacterium]